MCRSSAGGGPRNRDRDERHLTGYGFRGVIPDGDLYAPPVVDHDHAGSSERGLELGYAKNRVVVEEPDEQLLTKAQPTCSGLRRRPAGSPGLSLFSGQWGCFLSSLASISQVSSRCSSVRVSDHSAAVAKVTRWAVWQARIPTPVARVLPVR